MLKKISATFIVLMATLPAYGLVDYTEPASKGFKPASSSSKSVAKPTVRRVRSRAKSSGSSFGLTPSVGYETKDLDNAKAQVYNFGAALQTSYGIFMDVNYWCASSDSLAVIESSEFQSGNLNTSIGFNWLSLGDASNRMTLDLAFGAVWANSDSEFGSSRLDKTVTVSSSKRFYRFALGLEYQLRLVGDPKNGQEISIGNVHRIAGVLGWVATSDISFELEGALYKIGSTSELGAAVSYSYLSPKLNLQLSPLVELQIGGLFRAQRADVTDQLLGAKLWDMPGVYSNSIFANLNLSL